MAQSWFIMRGEARLGPFTHHGLVSLAANGGLTPTDMVWCTDLRTPIPASGVAGLFPMDDAGFDPDPEPQNEPAREPPRTPAPLPAPTAPSLPRREGMLMPPPPPRAVQQPSAEAEFSFGPRRKDRFATLFEDTGDVATEDDENEPEPEDDEPLVPMVRRPTRRVMRARKKADHSGLLVGLGGLALLAVIMLIVILEQGEDEPPPRPKRATPSVPVAQPRPQTQTPPPVARPEPPPPPPPRFDKQPLIDEMAKSAVDAIFQSSPSVKSRFRSLWQSQVTDQLMQATKGMREEQEIRATVTKVCDAWAAETRRFVAEQETEEKSPKAPSPDAIDKASGDEPAAEGGGDPNADATPAADEPT